MNTLMGMNMDVISEIPVLNDDEKTELVRHKNKLPRDFKFQSVSIVLKIFNWKSIDQNVKEKNV